MKIRARELIKEYGDRRVVNGINFEIRNGQILGLLGPNGAGKSTTIKMLSGQLKPTSGVIEIDGKEYRSVPGEFRTRIGVMPQEVVIWEGLTVKENLYFTGQLFGIKPDQLKRKADMLIEGLNLNKELDTVAKKLSGGFKRRLNLAITIINEPGAIFLDEPTPGIDPQNRRFLWEYISNLRNSDRSVILTDHYLDEAEKLADYVVVIDDGNVVASGTVRELKHKYGEGDLVMVHLDENDPQTQVAKLVTDLKTKFPQLNYAGDLISIQSADAVNIIRYVLNSMDKLKLKYKDFQMKEPTLEDIFLILTGKNVRE